VVVPRCRTSVTPREVPANDAIVAQGRLMCDRVAWATKHIAAGRLRGDILHLAWTPYFAGRGGMLAAAASRGPGWPAAAGTPIYAAAAGVVLSAHCSSRYCDRPGHIGLSGCGWTVDINHGGGIVTRYCHAIRLNVRAGQQVAAGHVVGWVGPTGNSSGPHLHFEVHRNAPPATNANAIDPIQFLRQVGLNP
jgi:murein DD-endopeptidase MepM/ murein hydrolase activator NlpD